MSTPTAAVLRPARYQWFAWGDLNGFFGLMFDNVTVMSFVAGILIFGFQFPAEVVYTRMFPGTALGVLLGDLVYTTMAIRLARKTNHSAVTAMPLGLDTPSSIGLTLAVLGPAFTSLKAHGWEPQQAAIMTWQIGMATMVLIGLIKLIFSFAGGWVRRAVPQAGLLGSIAGVGLALIGVLPMLDILSMPVVGMIALALLLYTLIAQLQLPFNIPGVLAAVGFGTLLYYILGPVGLAGGSYAAPNAALHMGYPLPTLGFLQGLRGALQYLPIAFPFAILTVVGGINVTESARVAGDDFSVRQILLTDAAATLTAGLCGGVAQTTPYIGHPAFKKMGSRAGYTLLAGLFIGIGGMLGYIGFIVELIPRAVLAPILIFVALEIVCQAFWACPARHAPAVAFAFLPSIASLLQIMLSNPALVPAASLQAALAAPGRGLPEMLVIVALGNGFILTALLWGAFLAEMIDRRLRQAALYLVLLGGFSFFGIIHSAMLAGNMYLPWNLPSPAIRIPYQFGIAYLAVAGMIFALSYQRSAISVQPPARAEG